MWRGHVIAHTTTQPGTQCGLGVTMHVQHAMHIFWEVAEFIANTLVFFYFGVIIAERIWTGHRGTDDGHVVEEAVLTGADWGWAVLNWVVLNVIRFCTISALKPFMGMFSDGFSWKDVVMATWAGLRGAVGLSLALIVYLAQREGGSNIDPTFAPPCLLQRSACRRKCRTPLTTGSHLTPRLPCQIAENVIGAVVGRIHGTHPDPCMPSHP